MVTISSDEGASSNGTQADAKGHKLGPVLTAHISALFNGCRWVGVNDVLLVLSLSLSLSPLSLSDINEISILTLKKCFALG